VDNYEVTAYFQYLTRLTRNRRWVVNTNHRLSERAPRSSGATLIDLIPFDLILGVGGFLCESMIYSSLVYPK
jgi:hypothetical protein